MTVLEKSAVAQKYYESTRSKTLAQGGERFVATDGTSCVVVDKDYVPENEEILVFRLCTSNFNVQCELLKFKST